MTDEELNAIEACANTAQPGPWWVVTVGKNHDDGPSHVIMSEHVSITEAFAGGEIPQATDAAFMAKSRTDVPDLIAEVRRLTAERDAAFASVREMWRLIGDVANECEPCPLPDDMGGGRLVPSDEVLAEWGRRCSAACDVARRALPTPESAPCDRQPKDNAPFHPPYRGGEGMSLRRDSTMAWYDIAQRKARGDRVWQFSLDDVCDLASGLGYSDVLRRDGYDPSHAMECWYDDGSLIVVCSRRLPMTNEVE